MKLRTIILLLSLLALLSITAGGIYYYYSLRESAYALARKRAAWQTEATRNRISSFLSDNLNTVRALAGLEEMSAALADPQGQALAAANAMLDHFQASLDVDVCYLMNRQGLTIASSNRNHPDSFVSKNFSFRPYFKEAMAGKPAKYLALGTTSKRRGAYYSHPVYGADPKQPLGVVVIKSPIRTMEENVIQSSEGVICLVAPKGVIFSSNRQDWIYKTLYKTDPNELAELAKSRQFGEGPWEWVGLDFEPDHRAVDRQGREFLYYSISVNEFPGWKIYNLLDLRSVAEGILDPLVKTTTWIVFSLCIIGGLSVYHLYRKAGHEINRRKEAEINLRKSEARYRTLYHHTPAMLHSIDKDGCLLSVSDYWMEALGYRPEEVIGRPLTDFLTEKSKRYAEEVTLPTFFETGFCKEISHQFVKKDGEVVEVLLSAISERDDSSNILRSLAVSIDITERKRAEEELERAKEKLKNYSEDLERQVRERSREIAGFLQHTPAVVYMKDTDGKYYLVNSRFEELFGVGNEEVAGKTVFDIFPPEVAEQFHKNDLLVLDEKKSIQFEERIPHEDGEHFYLSVRFPIFGENGSIRRLCGISVDITGIKNAQEKLRRLSGGIMSNQEKERTAIARELHDELGQVLTALRMDAVWLKERLEKEDPKGADRARSMCELIDSTITEVGNIATRLRPAVLDDLGLLDALEWHTNDFEKRTGIVCILKKGDIPPVDGFIAIAVYRVAQEALTNAARHSGATHVEVSFERVDGLLTLTVQDNGRGFDPEMLQTQNEFGIAGMRERANLLGGELDILSQAGGGDLDSFDSAAKRYYWRGDLIKVMLADDHSIVRAGLRRIIEDAGDMEVVIEAADGREAIEMSRQTPPDVAVVDISMPGLDGLEVINQLLIDSPGLPVLVLTMHEEEQYVIRTISAGARGYITKRSAPEQLVKAIRQLFTGGRYLSPEAAESLALHVARGEGRKTSLESLSNRELQVLRALALGHTNREIAENYHISPKTVDTYRFRLLKKLNLRNNADISRFAMQHGLIEP